MAGTRPSHAAVHASVLVSQNAGLAACRSKAIKEARLVERKVYFILDAGNWGWGGSWTPVQRPIACTDKWG